MAEVYEAPTPPAPAPKKRNKWLIGCLGLFALLVVCGGLASVMNGGKTASTVQPTTVAAPTTAPAEAVALPTEGAAATEPPTITEVAPAESPVAPVSTEAPTDAVPAGGITFGKVLDLSANGLNMVAVPVTNAGDTVKSFTVKATWKTGDTIAGTAIGAVNSITPGQTRAVSLIAQEAIPSTFDTVRVDVDTLIQDAASTDASEAAGKITFGAPKVTASAGMTMMDVEVTNGDDASHTFTIQAMIMNNGELVGVGTGSVNDLAAGQTKTASLLIQGVAEGDISLIVETLVQ
jgi:hypothetical protein